MILFSVIIPTYNRAHLITETVQSVLDQTYLNFELIIIDDGSTDNTEQLIKNSYGLDPRVRYFKKINEERGAARNFGLQQAKGDYAVFFDSDDRMMPGNLQSLISVINKYPHVFMLATKYEYDHHGKKEKHPLLKNLKEGWYDRKFFLKGNCLACNYCIRIHDHSYKLFPDQRELASMEDWLFLLMNLETEKIYIKEDIGVIMRQHDNRSMMNNQNVIDARKKATKWALENMSFSATEQKILKAWTHYFCGIHYYLDQKGMEGIKQAVKAIRLRGLKSKFFILLIKSFFGRKIINQIR